MTLQTSELNDLIQELDQLKFIDEAGSQSLHRLYSYISGVFVHATAHSQLYFATLFSRMSYALGDKKYPGNLKFHLHHFRVQVEGKTFESEKWEIEGVKQLFSEGKWAIWKYLELWSGKVIPMEADFAFAPKSFHKAPENARREFFRHKRVLVIAEGDDPKTLRAIDESEPDSEVIISYGEIGRNDIYTRDIQQAIQCPGFPFMLSIVDIEIEVDGIMIPKYLVIEPDFLIDVSTIAECSRDFQSPALLNLLRKFLPVESNPAILMGHIANSFLDTLIHFPESTFKGIFHKVFQLNPLAFTCLSDSEIIQMMKKAQGHFSHLHDVVTRDFHHLGIERVDCIIEPSFYAPVFGIQGRLDLFHESADKPSGSDIIELKSGSLFRPNLHGLNSSHYTQTLLYDLLIRSVRKFRSKNQCYILYSGQSEKTLRFAPTVDSLQKEAIHVRNQLVLLEARMRTSDAQQLSNMLNQISTEVFSNAKGFLLRNIENFERTYAGLSPGEKIYFNLYSGFIAREFALSKVGEQGVDTINGLASLWLDSTAEKEQKYSIFQGIRLLSILKEKENTTLVNFEFEGHREILSNFRVGDIAVLYPYTESKEDVLSHQIYKCTLIEIRPDGLLIKLRNHQINHKAFRSFTYWNLEHDTLDSSFIALFRSLYSYAGYEPMKRSIFLGTIPPHQSNTVETIPKYDQMLPEQMRVLRKMIEAQDYFLLWGPPGTGKTSVMIKYAVKYYLESTEDNILLLAYTNRAVDEICASIESLGGDVKNLYTRIGSRVGTHPAYRSQLFATKTQLYTRRKEILAFLKSQRIFVATISSVISKEELFKLKQFDISIIDEASQVLEPMLAGLLMRIKKNILIGDHKQLPAVVMQRPSQTLVDDLRMNRIGLNDMRNSYFERLYHLCQDKKWEWAYDKLTMQGRMHQEIMDFANQHFYEGGLTIINTKHQEKSHQVGEITYEAIPKMEEKYRNTIFQRLSFLDASVSKRDLISKTNMHEAQTCAELIRILKQTYELNGIEWSPGTLGIITPFRAQIALIRKVCLDQKISIQDITIDTVERYQGSARDIIILSTAVSTYSQLSIIVAANQHKIDRKFNVSITRARKQFILLGDSNTLTRNKTYANFIKSFRLKPDD